MRATKYAYLTKKAEMVAKAIPKTPSNCRKADLSCAVIDRGIARL